MIIQRLVTHKVGRHPERELEPRRAPELTQMPFLAAIALTEALHPPYRAGGLTVKTVGSCHRGARQS